MDGAELEDAELDDGEDGGDEEDKDGGGLGVKNSESVEDEGGESIDPTISVSDCMNGKTFIDLLG